MYADWKCKLIVSALPCSNNRPEAHLPFCVFASLRFRSVVLCDFAFVYVPALRHAMRSAIITRRVCTKRSKGPVSNTKPEQRHVLIADDDDGVRTMLHDLLEGEGYTVSEVR